MTLRKSSPPIVPRRREAPITATLRVSKKGRREAVTATWSRSASRSSNRSVRPIGNATSTSPPASSRVSSNPRASKTPSIRRLSGSTSATKRSMP